MRSRISLLLTMVAVFLCGYFFGRRGSAPASRSTDSGGTVKLALPAGLAVVGFLDQVDGKPEVSAAAGSDFHISGWAACADPQAHSQGVEILIDNQPQVKNATAISRPDVAAAYGRPDFEKSGWKADLSTRNLTAGAHPITARVACTNGQAGTLPPFRLMIRNP
jgi:hypothetical protein